MNNSFGICFNIRRALATHQRLLALAVLGVALSAPVFPGRSAEDAQMSPPQQRRGGGEVRGVYKSRIAPNWFANDTRFWYRNDLRGGTKEFILVNVEKGTRAPAFDHAKLAAALSKAT